ncbi:hypothetical protein ACFRCG_06935 [Embleya sp. NPDC056575]|uniref:hypothetical protein n=1 Tax=unclassified Embleya TaxID=2699296 RepID=UPI0036B1A42E
MRNRIAAMAMAGGAALALMAPLANTAQAATASNITRSSACTRFDGKYSYWKVGSWFGYKLTGSFIRTCSGGGSAALLITGDQQGGGEGDYRNGTDVYLSYRGDRATDFEFGESGGVKDIRIALIDY